MNEKYMLPPSTNLKKIRRSIEIVNDGTEFCIEREEDCWERNKMAIKYI